MNVDLTLWAISGAISHEIQRRHAGHRRLRRSTGRTRMVCSTAGLCPSKVTVDYLALHTGTKIHSALQQLLIFATNLDPDKPSR